MFPKFKRNPLPKDKPVDFYWNLIKEADAEAAAASKARDTAAAEAERLDGRVRELGDELERVRATLALREQQLAELTPLHRSATAEVSRLGTALDERTDDLETARATLELRDRELTDLGAAHDELQGTATAATRRVTELEAEVQTISDERAAAIASAEATRTAADQQLAKIRAERDGLRAHLQSTLEAITAIGERHQAELAAECRLALAWPDETPGAASGHDTSLEGRRSEPVAALAS